MVGHRGYTHYSNHRTVLAGTNAPPHWQAAHALPSAAVSHFGQIVLAKSFRSAFRLSTRRAMKMMGEPTMPNTSKRIQNVPP
jgi:hypothetical protein